MEQAEKKPKKVEETPVVPALGEEVDDEKAQAIRRFLTGLMEQMEVSAVIKVYQPEKGRYKVFLEGEHMGALIGRRMDKQKAELEKIEGAQVETVTDENDLQAIKVTFNDKILFATGKSDLSDASRSALGKFAASLVQSPETDIAIYGHTDNTGSRAVNQKLSEERAQAVANYLIGQKVDPVRITTRGLAYDSPIADNSTEEGRAQNRRVEILITANDQMIQQAHRHLQRRPLHRGVGLCRAERYDPPRTIAGRIDFSPAGPKNRSSRTRSFVSARQAAERSRIG